MDRIAGKKHYSKSADESADNKQDSGVDSDCQPQLSVTVSQPKIILENPSAGTYERNDELLILLDLINQRGITLRQRVDEYEDQMQRPEQLETLSYQDVASLLHKLRGLQKRLKDAYCEKEHLRSQLDLYENVVATAREEKRRLQEKFDQTLQEKNQLETKIHRLHGQFVKGSEQENWVSDSAKTAKDLEKSKRLKRRSLDENKMKISEVLKEKSSLELQRQMLHMILENETLSQSLAQSEQQRLSGIEEWEKRELQMRMEISNLNKEKTDLTQRLSQSKIDNTDVLAKVKLLERALQAVSQDSKTANQQFDPTSAAMKKRRASASTYNQMLKPRPSATAGVFQSLPPGIEVIPHSQNQLVYVENEIHPLIDTSGYLNISLEEPELEALENPELDFRKILPTSRSSTPVRSSTSNVKYISKLEVNPCKSRSFQSAVDHSDITSICSELDPLTHVYEGKTFAMSEFMDSLDALPSNNIMFVPVSVAKACTRSEKPKYSSPLLQRLSYPNVIQRSTERSNGEQYPVQGAYHQIAASIGAGLL